MPKNEILQDVTIDKLIFWGKWLDTAPDGRKVIISWGCIPGSIVNIRILKARKSHYEGQQLDVIQKSPLEIPLPEGFQMYGWAKWLTIGYENQLSIKSEQVREAFHHLREYVGDTTWHPIVASPKIYGYRNKVEFSFGKYISARENIHDEFRFGFHAQGQFDRIEDCTYCALADEETNDIFHEVDTLSRSSGLPTYDPKTAVGFWRHFVVRKGKERGECMLIFSINAVWREEKIQEEGSIEHIFTHMVQKLTEKYKNIASIYFLENTGRADIVTGNAILLFGKASIEAELLGLNFEIQPKSFFQVNTFWAEKLYTLAIDFIHDKWWTLLDLYAGTGTIGILLSKYFSTVYSVELVESASADGQKNADKNHIKNVQFVNAKVEDFSRDFSLKSGKADVIILDPPRDWLHPSAIPYILSFGAKEIIYVSCNPATLSRDLETFVGKNRDTFTEVLPKYCITDIAPVDMFPHTHHIETVVRLERLP
jgi:23S rRNA (uracil1939-C5)-methyltransferase